MAKDFIAIDTEKKIYEFSQFGIESLKERHRIQKVTGWMYGLKSDKNELLSKIITVKDAQDAVAENALLKQRIAELTANENKGVETQKRSEKKK